MIGDLGVADVQVKDAKFLVIALLLAVFGLSLSVLLLPHMQGAYVPETVVGGDLFLIGFAFFAFQQKGDGLQKWFCRPSFDKRVLIQAAVQCSILVFLFVFDLNRSTVGWWSYLVFQLCFAFVFDSLLQSARGKPCTLQIYVLPMVLSINLFIWVRPPYFFLQIILVAVGVAAKNLIKRADGRSHVFNPSAFALTFAWVLLNALALTGHNQYVMKLDAMYATHPLLPFFLLAVSCVPLWLPDSFLVPTGALAVFAAAFPVISLHDMVANPYPYVPLGVLIGITLFVTDPKTSPRTKVGKLFFGAAYGVMIIYAVQFLKPHGLDPYYAKILPVPLLNFFAPYFDRLDRLKFWRTESESFYLTRPITMTLFICLFFFDAQWMF